MAATMAFRVAQLQGLAHTDAQLSSPPSLLYESPSNHKVTADSTKEETAAQPAENPPCRLNHAEESSSVDSINLATAEGDPSSQNCSITTNHTAIPDRPLQPRKVSADVDRVISSRSTSNTSARRRAAGPVPAYSTTSKHQRLASDCSASDEGCREATNKQRFLNVFKDENSAEVSCPAPDPGSLQRFRSRFLMQDTSAAKAVAADDDTALGSVDRYFPRRSAFRRGSVDSSRVHNRYSRMTYRSSDIYRESSSECSTDVAPVKPARSVRWTPGYSAGSEDSTYDTRKGHVNSNEEGYEQPRRAFSPRYDHPPSYTNEGRPVHHGETSFPHPLGSRAQASMSASTLPSAGNATPTTTTASTPGAAGCVTGAAALDGTRAAACAAGASPLGGVSSRYCGDTFSEDVDDCESEELLGWKGWRELLLERQRAMEEHMRAQRRHIVRREKVPLRAPNKEGGGRQRGRPVADTHTHASSVHSSTESDTEDETTSKDEDPLGLSPQLTAAKRSRSVEKSPTATATPRPPASPPQQYAATSPPTATPVSSFSTARNSTPPLPGGPPFFGPSFPAPPFYPSWPPPFYAAAVAAAAAARRAGEEAGMTGQERIQDLKKALEQAKKEIQDNQEEARIRLEEEKKKHEEEREELKKQLAQLRATLEEREKDATVVAAKHAEAEKQKKVLREEFDIITRVHKDMKEEFQREKESFLAEKASLQTNEEITCCMFDVEAKVDDLERSIEFSKDQLLVARESLVAARAKQLTATQAHEQDLKTLKEYRLEIETLREDLKYLQILNLSLTEKVQRFSAGPPRGQQIHAQTAAAAGRRRSGLVITHGRMAAFPPQQADFHQCAQHGGGISCSNTATQRLPPQAMPTLQQLLSPQLQQKLLRDRQNECRGAAACAPPLKEATFTLPSSLESHGEPPAASSSADAACNGGTAVGLRGESKKRESMSTFAQTALCAASAAAAETACTVNSARARLRTVSPASQTFGREADAPTSSLLPRVVATAPRCRSLPLPASATSAAPAAPSGGKHAQVCHFANSMESEEEIRLARLCATVLAAHSQREQKRPLYAAEGTDPSPAAVTPSALCRESSSFFPTSQCLAAALLHPDFGDTALAPEEQHGPQQCHLQQHQYVNDHRSHLPPPARRTDTSLSIETNTFSSRKKREDYVAWPSFDRGSSAIEEETPTLNASNGTAEKSGVSISAQHEQRLQSDASHLCTEKRVAPTSYVNNAEQSYLHAKDDLGIVSDFSHANMFEPCLEGGKQLSRFHPRTTGVNLPSWQARADSPSARGGKCPADLVLSSENAPGSSASKMGKQRFSHEPCAAAHSRSALDEQEENAAPSAGLSSAVATARVGARCLSHHTEEESSFASYNMQISGTNKADSASNVGVSSETESSKGADSSSTCAKREAQEESTPGGSGDCRKEDDAQRSGCNADENYVGNVGISGKVHVRSSNIGENKCNGSGLASINSEKGISNRGRIPVPALALKGVCPSVSRPSDTRGIGTGSSSLCSGPNSARTQWLLNRVARISRLQGLHNIHEKLKDLPPALLAASDSARRSCQEKEAHKAASNGNTSDNGGENINNRSVHNVVRISEGSA